MALRRAGARDRARDPAHPCARRTSEPAAVRQRRASRFRDASGGSWRIGDLIEKFRAHARAPFEIVIDPKRLRPSDVPMAAGSAQRLERATGWKPTIGVDAILEDLLAHWRAAGAA